MKINDITKHNWRDYTKLAPSLWTFKHDTDRYPRKTKFHGAFVFQVAWNLINRYTQMGGNVADLFGGSGTTERAAMVLGRNSYLFDLNYPPKDTKGYYSPKHGGTFHIKVQANTTHSSLPIRFFNRFDCGPVDLVILHPPYEGAVKFSDREVDLSNMDHGLFMKSMSVVFDNALNIVKTGGHVALVYADIMLDGKFIPAYRVASLGEDIGLVPRATFIKNISEGTQGKRGQINLWKYRALVNGLATFAHEYIFIFRREF